MVQDRKVEMSVTIIWKLILMLTMSSSRVFSTDNVCPRTEKWVSDLLMQSKLETLDESWNGIQSWYTLAAIFYRGRMKHFREETLTVTQTR